MALTREERLKRKAENMRRYRLLKNPRKSTVQTEQKIAEKVVYTPEEKLARRKLQIYLKTKRWRERNPERYRAMAKIREDLRRKPFYSQIHAKRTYGEFAECQQLLLQLIAELNKLGYKIKMKGD